MANIEQNRKLMVENMKKVRAQLSEDISVWSIIDGDENLGMGGLVYKLKGNNINTKKAVAEIQKHLDKTFGKNSYRYAGPAKIGKYKNDPNALHFKLGKSVPARTYGE